jgi:hypothetical protein
MFQSTFSSLGQVIGWRKARSDSQVPIQEERRIWVRYPCNVEAVCQPADAPESQRISAQVRNVSRGGINLLMPSPVETGSLMSVELPCAADQNASTVLAYVVRADPTDDGDWSVGCSFATELDDHDLEPFGAKRQKPHPLDQRTWVRFPCHAQATFHVIKSDDTQSWPTQIVNISANGVGLQTERPLELGKLLNLDLRSADGQFTLSILACVVRVTTEADGHWSLGCNLIRELSDKEIKALL